MMKLATVMGSVCLVGCLAGAAAAQQRQTQDIPTRWDELTASDWDAALQKSAGVAILPIGILEKHGPQGPIGSDLIRAREWAARVVKQEYAVVFPDYFYGQIYEARHQPGTFALPSRLVWELLDATCAEIARNGFKKIMIVNTHGGNPNMLRFFVQSQLEKQRDYVVYLYDPAPDAALTEKLNKARKSDPATDQHGGERETSELLYLRPELVKQDRSNSESGENQKRLSLPDIYTGIWWYASYPNHYAGDGSVATKEFGQLITDTRVESIVKALKTIKADTKTPALQKEFFDRVRK
jgi:creatinine amidohydrolase